MYFQGLILREAEACLIFENVNTYSVKFVFSPNCDSQKVVPFFSFCIGDFFIINIKIYIMSHPQNFHVERVSNLNCFNVMKQTSFKKHVMEATLTNSGDQRHTLLAQENQDNS